MALKSLRCGVWWGFHGGLFMDDKKDKAVNATTNTDGIINFSKTVDDITKLRKKATEEVEAANKMIEDMRKK